MASVSGVGPWAAEGLDFLAGMGEGNEIEFGAALEGEAPLRELLVPWREEMVSAGAEGTFASMQSVLSPPDQKVFTGEVAAHLHASVSLALRDGVDGWVDDDLAFTRPWGFAPADVQRAGLPVAGGAGPHGAPGARPLAGRAPAETAGRGCCPTTVTSRCWSTGRARSWPTSPRRCATTAEPTARRWRAVWQSAGGAPYGRSGDDEAPDPEGRGLREESGWDAAAQSDQIVRSLSACGPLGPWVTSNSTRWASSSER